jgi:cytochrome c oxidase subunit 1
MSAVVGQPGIHPESAGSQHAADEQHHGAPHGWRRWVYATNHKDIGTMYLLFSFTMFMVGGALALGMRLELFQPGLQFMNPHFYNQLVTMHGLIMVFGPSCRPSSASRTGWCRCRSARRTWRSRA